MKQEELDSRISKSDWEKTPDSVKEVVAELAERVEQLNSQIALLNSQISPLAEQMRELEEKLDRRKKVSRPRKRGFGQSIRLR